MSYVMLFGVLEMPPELWGDDPLDKMQRHSRYVQAASEIRSLRAENAEAQELIESAIPYVRAAMQEAESRHDDSEADTYMDGVQYEIMCECREWLDKVAALRGEGEK